jgi:hypothetical protein
MNSDPSRNALLAVAIVVGCCLLIGFLTTIVGSKAGEAAGALGGVLGGVIGAVGAALAVALTLSGERSEERRKEQEKQVSQINVAIAGVSYNIEILLHVVSDFIIPHHSESHIVFNALLDAQGDPQKPQEVVSSFSAPNYPALRKTCPELQFIEWNFFKEAPFIAEKDPELLKNTGWYVANVAK